MAWADLRVINGGQGDGPPFPSRMDPSCSATALRLPRDLASFGRISVTGLSFLQRYEKMMFTVPEDG